MSKDDYEYDVTVSFAGEDRPIAEQFAEQLKVKGFNVFYDNWNKADMWGADLFQHLDDIYTKKARFCVIFISAAYLAKAWTNHELKSAQARAFQQNSAYILPVRIDDSIIPGIRPTLGYIDLRQQSIEDVVRLAAQKITEARSRGSRHVVQAPSPSVPPMVSTTAPSRVGKLRIKRQFTEQERDVFLEETFEVVAKYFQDTLTALSSEVSGLTGKFKRVNTNHFTATIYREGKNVGQCGIRLGGLGGGFSNQIVYSSDPNATNSMNESVSVADDGEEMFLNAMGMAYQIKTQRKDHLSPLEVADFFWSILASPLQR